MSTSGRVDDATTSPVASLKQPLRIVIVHPAYPENDVIATNRFAPLLLALNAHRIDDDDNDDPTPGAAGVVAESCVYYPENSQKVLNQLQRAHAALVFYNPIQDGIHVRSQTLDPLLRMVSSNSNGNTYVSTHPETIATLGTKRVLYDTRHLSWSSDEDIGVALYTTERQFEQEFPTRLLARSGTARVLKYNVGQSGSGVFKVELLKAWGSKDDDKDTNMDDDNNVTTNDPVRQRSTTAQPTVVTSIPAGTVLRVWHAQRGRLEETMTWEQFLERIVRPAFVVAAGDDDTNHVLIDQVYQARLPEGMIRCYMVHDKVCGFGHQADNALVPGKQPGPRLYYDNDWEPGQVLRHQLETEWIPQLLQSPLMETLTRNTENPVERGVCLPLLWDLDFLLGPQRILGDNEGKTHQNTYVLCEINVSSVSPFPESAIPHIVKALVAQTQSRQQLELNK